MHSVAWRGIVNFHYVCDNGRVYYHISIVDCDCGNDENVTYDSNYFNVNYCV